MLAIMWSTLKQVNNHYHCRKVNNYKSLHKENVSAINASGLLCRRRGAIKMLIELDLSVRWSSEVVMRTSSVANKRLNIMALLSIKPRGSEQDNHFTRRNVKLCVLWTRCVHVNISRLKKKIWIFPRKISVNLSIKFIGMMRDISSEELILIYLGLTNTPLIHWGINLPVFNKYSKYAGVLICLRLTNTVICLYLTNTLGINVPVSNRYTGALICLHLTKYNAWGINLQGFNKIHWGINLAVWGINLAVSYKYTGALICLCLTTTLAHLFSCV